jgi:hypothetical protein
MQLDVHAPSHRLQKHQMKSHIPNSRIKRPNATFANPATHSINANFNQQEMMRFWSIFLRTCINFYLFFDAQKYGRGNIEKS